MPRKTKQSIEHLKQSIIDAIKDNQDKIIEQITTQKYTMFEDNSHAWALLKPQTIERKKRERDLFSAPESINIRKGGLFKAFINPNSYQAVNGNRQIEFNINLDGTEQSKVNIAATHGRDVVEITQAELDEITAAIVTIIKQTLKVE